MRILLRNKLIAPLKNSSQNDIILSKYWRIMRYKSCSWINGGLDFRPDSIVLCCFSWLQGYEEYVLVDNYFGEKIDWAKLFEKKRALIDLQKSGKTADFCHNCIYQEERDWVDDDSINCLLFNHWTNCNSACIYCDLGQEHEFYNRQKSYDILPILKDMNENGILKIIDGSFVSFGGGEPTVLKDFDEILNLLIEVGFKVIRINTSGIKYSKAIEDGLKNKSVDIVTSVDSGSAEIYRKIKRVDCFDKVWQNLKNYAKSAANKNDVKAKFIIIPDVNNTQKDIDDFFDCVEKNDLRAVSFSVEKNWANDTPAEIFRETDKAKKIYDLLLYSENKSRELGLFLELYSEGIGFKNLMQKQ